MMVSYSRLSETFNLRSFLLHRKSDLRHQSGRHRHVGHRRVQSVSRRRQKNLAANVSGSRGRLPRTAPRARRF